MDGWIRDSLLRATFNVESGLQRRFWVIRSERSKLSACSDFGLGALVGTQSQCERPISNKLVFINRFIAETNTGWLAARKWIFSSTFP